jgi:MinD-like ATPase involved in chromosome partitioning or flagellar assembly
MNAAAKQIGLIPPAVMPDQAHDLRRLATHREYGEMPRCGTRPALIVVAGGKGGVGTTTVALNLAGALTRAGVRSLLVDADPCGDAALLCDIEERYTLADVLAGRRTWDEATCFGSDGVRLIVGQRGWDSLGSSAATARQLVDRLSAQDMHADAVVIDAGNRLGGIVPHVCGEADAVVMVTTTDAASVVDTFDAIKAFYHPDLAPSFHREENLANSVPPRRPSSVGRNQLPWHCLCQAVSHRDEKCDFEARLYLLVNMTPEAREAETVHYRLARTCRRTLGINLQSCGHLTMATPRKNRMPATIGLNIQASLVDTVRRVLAVKQLLSWQKHIKFNAASLRQSPNL